MDCSLSADNTVPAERTSFPAIGCLLLYGALALTGCASIPTKTYDIRQRAFTYKPTALVQDYQEEYAYIRHRWQAVLYGNDAPDNLPLKPVTEPPLNLAGLAFSGGGIRSATFHLGLLEALHDMKTLPRIDYLSTVSGGSYIAGWMLAHLGKEQDDAYGTLVQTPDEGEAPRSL